jgi:hypothetical protein
MAWFPPPLAGSIMLEMAMLSSHGAIEADDDRLGDGIIRHRWKIIRVCEQVCQHPRRCSRRQADWEMSIAMCACFGVMTRFDGRLKEEVEGNHDHEVR